MARYEINGGNPLNGTVTISGAKNAAVAILPATLLVKGKCRIENVPYISDIDAMSNILYEMGAKITCPEKHVLEIDCSEVQCTEPNADLVRKMRASYYLMGALLGRFGKAKVALPGGCSFASRPIDQHIKGFLLLGADVDDTDEYVALEPGPEGLRGGRISLDMASVGATINIMLAACRASGTTVIDNAAREPHIVDVASFLNSCGANIMGAGTPTIKIVGVENLYGSRYAVVPDMIEAGTYIMAAAATKGEVTVTNVIPRHLESLTAKLLEMGVNIEEGDDSITVHAPAPDAPPMHAVRVKTAFYPGFPTDMHPRSPPFSALQGAKAS